MIGDAVEEIATFAKNLGFKVTRKRMLFPDGFGYQLLIGNLRVDVFSEHNYLVDKKRLSETYEVKKEILKCTF